MLKKMDPNQIVCVIDAYDVLACDTPNILVSKFLSYNKDIVIGGENNCAGNCTILDRYFEQSKNPLGRYQYANSGFYKTLSHCH